MIFFLFSFTLRSQPILHICIQTSNLFSCFDGHPKLASGMEYYLINVVSAKSSIENMDARSLSMDDGEFKICKLQVQLSKGLLWIILVVCLDHLKAWSPL